MAPFVLLVLLFLCGAASGEEVISVNPGDDVTLPCWSADPNIRAVQWTRTDLKSEHVLLSRDGHFISRNQHPFFQGRVQLVDRDLKDGDLSFTLKRVKSSDEGTYECRVKVGDSTQQKIEETEPIRRVRLQVTDPEVKSVNPGDDVTLPCQSADPNIIVVEWTRTDLKPEYIFLYRDGHLDPENQHPSFQGRVQLVDRDLKDRDVSLTLKKVSSSDNGTYECRVKVDGSTRKKRSIIDDQPIRTVRLQVTGSDHGAMMDGDKKDGGRTHMYIGVTAAVLFLVCSSLVGLFVFRKSKRHLNNDPEAAAADEAENDELI